jgi:S1-C subfamily serine protease
VRLYSSGTAFLVKAGMMLTSRHVAEPWWRDESSKRFTQSGFRPAIILFRAFFPGLKEPFPLYPHRFSNEADVALVRFDPKGKKLPILKLDRRPTGAMAGNRVILIGYPAGRDALLARVETATLKKIIDRRGNRMGEVTEELSKRGLIRPLTTWGHLSDVQADYVIYDALTTSGGSGSPLLNTQGRVIGINQSMLKSFSGSNFGVPIRFGMELME